MVEFIEKLVGGFIMAEEKKWKTAITKATDEAAYIRGYELTELIDKLNFTQMIFLILKGELPSKKEERMMNAILVATAEHGIAPPSITAARTVFSGGSPLNAAVAAGVLAIGESHGGAIEQCARMLQEGVKSGIETGTVAKAIVKKAREEGKRLPGFGHRIYVDDPRTKVIFKVAKEQGFYGKHVELAVTVREELEKALNKKMPLNVDGAIAAIASEMGFDWKLGKGFFIIGRTVGITAHVFEEWTREKPFRRLDESEIGYDGVEPRKLPADFEK